MANAPNGAGHRAVIAQRTNRLYALILASLCALFGLRVLGQAIQLWAPQRLLPAFDSFQGSNVAYGLLLSTQLVLIALMVGVTSRILWGALQKSARSARLLGCIGGIYMAGSLGRIGLGLTLSQPSPWFTAWIPAIFHVVLAAFILTLAAYHADRDKQVTP
jgi:hypothetical protein